MLKGVVNKLRELVEDASSVEACVVRDADVRLYSRIEFEGDSLNWVGKLDEDEVEWLPAVQAEQIRVAVTTRLAIVRMASSTLKAIKP